MPSQFKRIAVKAPDASKAFGAGGTDKSPGFSSGGPKSIAPAFGLKGLPANCLAKPLSISSLSVTALSLGSPLLPSLTSSASFIDSKVALVSYLAWLGYF
jgi:hypothetical protein